MSASARKKTYSDDEMSLEIIMGVSLCRLMEIEMESRNPSNPR